MQQSSVLPTITAGWQGPQPPMFVGNDFSVGTQAQFSNGQVPAWDSSLQVGRTAFVSSTFPSHTMGPPVPPYSTAGTLPGPSSDSFTGYGTSGNPQIGRITDALPGAPSSGQPPLHYLK